MRPVARLLLISTLGLSAPLGAQQPVQPYEAATRYRTFNVGLQITGEYDRGRDLIGAWGRMYTAGSVRASMTRFELAAGVRTGTDIVERVMAGPRVSVAQAFPPQFVALGKKGRAEPYLIATAGAYGIGDFRRDEDNENDDESEWGVAPALSAGVGFRIFSDEWDVDLTMFEVVVEKRLGFGDERAAVYVRFGQATAPRERPPRPEPIAFLPPPPPPGTSP